MGKVESNERGETVTGLCAFSASGNYVPPALVFNRKRMRPELIKEAPAGSIGFISDSGFS